MTIEISLERRRRNIFHRGSSEDKSTSLLHRDVRRDDCRIPYCRYTGRDDHRNVFRRDVSRDDCRILVLRDANRDDSRCTTVEMSL